MARLREAGAILVGKTNAAMLLADYQTDNPLFGSTNNPWDLERTPGGSSGGAAAALAAGMTPFEIGTDMAGLDPHSGAFLRRVRAEADREPRVAGRRISQSGRCAAQHTQP